MIKNRLPLLCSFLLCFCFTQTSAQDSSKFQIDGYVEAYYTYDSRKPLNVRYPFLTNFNRHNQVAINLASIKAKYNGDGIRANFGLQAGTFPIDNYRSEPNPLYSYIQEANVGIAIGKSRRFWLDAGVLPSHLGFETTNAFQNLTLSRSLSAENSPYYLTGANVSYMTKNKKWKFALWTSNGWGNITRVDQKLWVGLQVKYEGKSFEFNYGNLAGEKSSGPSATGYRIFNNANLKWKPNNKITFIGGVDFGIQEKVANYFNPQSWFAYTLIGQYKMSKKFAGSLRFEYFDDVYGALGTIYQNLGLQCTGLSANLDYAVTENALLRIEGRYFGSQYDQFIGNPNTTSIISSLAIRF